MKRIFTSELLLMLNQLLQHIGRRLKEAFNSRRIIITNQKKLVKRVTVYIMRIILTQIACSDNIIDNNISSIAGEWVFLGFEDKIAYNLVLDEPVLYACAGKDGLWRNNISIKNSNWQYLGLAYSSGLYPPMHAVTDIDVYYDTLLAAMYWLNEREEYQDVGIWKSTDDGTTWNRSDSGIARGIWPYSSMWSVKRSPFNPAIVSSAVGTTFRSTNAAKNWYQVDPADTGGRGESFVQRIKWHPKKVNEVWIYGQGNIFGPILAVSKDWGETWYHLLLDLNNETPVYEIAFDAVEENFIYLASDFGILRSSSSGEDWENQSWEIPPYIISSNGEFSFTGLATNPVISGEAYFTGGDNLYLTKNYGENISMSNIPNNLIAGRLVYCLDLDMLIIGTNSGIIGFKIEH